MLLINVRRRASWCPINMVGEPRDFGKTADGNSSFKRRGSLIQNLNPSCLWDFYSRVLYFPKSLGSPTMSNAHVFPFFLFFSRLPLLKCFLCTFITAVLCYVYSFECCLIDHKAAAPAYLFYLRFHYIQGFRERKLLHYYFHRAVGSNLSHSVFLINRQPKLANSFN